MKSSRMLTLALAGAVATGGLLAAPASAAAAARPAPDLVSVVPSFRLFSPNGDGVQDRLRVGFSMRQDGAVTVTVRRSGSGAVVRHANLGMVPRGSRSWVWNGRDDKGRQVHNGNFQVVVRVERRHAGRLEQDRVVRSVAARSTYTPAKGSRSGFVLSRDTLYPTTTAFTDVVYIDAWQQLRNVDSPRHPYGDPQTTAIEIRDAAGHLVRSWRREYFEQLSRPWDGTDMHGDRVPAGTYSVAMIKRDLYGNPKPVRRTLTVSDVPLVAQPWSSTITAEAALMNREAKSEKDGWTMCPPQSSTRIAGGRTVLSPAAAASAYQHRCDSSYGRFAVSTPFDVDPMDQITVTATGSSFPTGGAGTATLQLPAWSTGPHESAQLSSGQTTLGPVALGHDLVQVTPKAVNWSVDGRNLGTTEFDLASFDVHVVHYVPQP